MRRARGLRRALAIGALALWAPRRRAPSPCSSWRRARVLGGDRRRRHAARRLARSDLPPVSLPMYYCRVAAGGRAVHAAADDRARRGHAVSSVRPQDGVLIVVFSGVDDTLGPTTRCWPPATAARAGRPPVDVGVLGEINDAALSPDGAFVDTVFGLVTGEVLFQRVPLGGGTERASSRWGPNSDVRPPRVTSVPDGPAGGDRPLRDRPARGAGARCGRRSRPSRRRGAAVGVALHRPRRRQRRATSGRPAPGCWPPWPRARRRHLPVRIWHWGKRGFARPAHDRRARPRLQRLGGPGPDRPPPSPSTSTSAGACTPPGR